MAVEVSGMNMDMTPLPRLPLCRESRRRASQLDFFVPTLPPLGALLVPIGIGAGQSGGAGRAAARVGGAKGSAAQRNKPVTPPHAETQERPQLLSATATTHPPPFTCPSFSLHDGRGGLVFHLRTRLCWSRFCCASYFFCLLFFFVSPITTVERVVGRRLGHQHGRYAVILLRSVGRQKALSR